MFTKVGLFIRFADESSTQVFSADYTTPSILTWNFADLNNVAEAEFRFYVWGDTDGNANNNKPLAFDNISVSGSISSITPVPEPYEYGLIAVAGLLSYGLFNRQRLKKT